MDVVDSGLDLSQDPKFTEAVAHKVYYGPVYFRRESEPYMTLSLAGTRKDAGVSIAEVNLKLIWDVVSQIKVGEHGHAYVVGPGGRLIAHPDISLVLRNTDMSKLVQVQAAQAGSTSADLESLQGTKNIQGQEVLTASAPIAPLGWTMFVELPVEEAYASLYLALQRLEDKKWISAKWGVSENNRKARFYSLTAKGRDQLVEKISEWQRLTRAMELILSGNAGPSSEEV